MGKRAARALLRACKWCVAGIALLELMSFLIITGSNYLLYGHAREGSRAKYDPHTLFQMTAGVRPTTHNRTSPGQQWNRTLWLFGGSTMRGATDRDDRTIPSALARALNGEGRSPLHFIVTNFGVNSFNSLLETQYLQKLLEEGQGPPDVIVFYDGANDAKYLAECRTPYGHHGYRKVQGIIESYYRSGVGLLKPLVAAVYASFSWELYDKFQQVAVPLDPASPLVREMVEATERRYDYVDRLAMCHGARFLLIWQPMLWVEGCSQRGTHGETDASAVGRAARWSAVAENFSVPYHALLERLQGKPYFSSFRDVLCDPSGPVYQPDGVHLTDEGRERVAWRIAELLMETAFGPP